MKAISKTFYKVHYGVGSEDCANCETLADAEFRQKEIRANQIERGYTPDETHIYLHTWTRVINDEAPFILSETSTMVLVK